MKWLLRVVIAGIVISAVSGLNLFRHEMTSLPLTAAEWRLASQVVFKPVPPELRNWRSGEYARKAWRGAYVGPVPITLTVYDMPRYARTAWDAIQQWRVAPGKMAFFKNGCFGIAESPGATQEDLRRFVHALWPGDETLR
jgi:hypothetical protein